MSHLPPELSKGQQVTFTVEDSSYFDYKTGTIVDLEHNTIGILLRYVVEINGERFLLAPHEVQPAPSKS